jgi:hypothetical protein
MLQSNHWCDVQGTILVVANAHAVGLLDKTTPGGQTSGNGSTK